MMSPHFSSSYYSLSWSVYRLGRWNNSVEFRICLLFFTLLEEVQEVYLGLGDMNLVLDEGYLHKVDSLVVELI